MNACLASKNFRLQKHSFDSLTLAALNNKTSKTVLTRSNEELKIRASMKVGVVENLFLTTFGVTVQIKDKTGNKLIDNKLTLGDAIRLEK